MNMILCLLDLLLQDRDGLCGRIDQLFGLPQVEHRCNPALLPHPNQFERLLSRFERASGDLERIVELPQSEISRSNFADQSRNDGLSELFSAKESGARGFGLTPQTAPCINLE